VDKEENSRVGVYWLIKASEQGNVEATDLLKRCLETGQGKVSFETLLF
jgi:wolfamin